MEFTEAERNETFDICRLISLDGEWELGMRKMLYGIRVGAIKSNSCAYTLDYCAGADAYFAMTMLAIVKEIFRLLDPTMSEGEIERMFPREETRPNTFNSPCFQEVLQLLVRLKQDNCTTLIKD